ncbi:MAG TPA: DegT/DnrJ/EryC1/StrS family aminotransferase [Anaerolineales bacterium]|nr:DegT/DnrJ/EryC1/StrS family aminotransferase [Anaerolineales bacterium]
MEWQIPLSDIDFGPEEKAAVDDVLQSKWLTMGSITQEFEQAFAAYVGAKYAIAVTNATAALHLACVVAGLGPGDEAVVPSLTFVATANAVRYTGASPVFADIADEQDLNISYHSIEKAITERTRAILVMHYGGDACDMPSILELAREHQLMVIEDAAHAVGSELEGRKLGTWGHIGCFSFFSNKNMTTGEGGMLVTNDEQYSQRLHLLRSHGMTTLTWDRHKGHASSYDVVDLGYNYRIDEIRAALGVVQLRKLALNNERRRCLTQVYRDVLQELAPEVAVPFTQHVGISAAHLMPILLPAGSNKLRFMENMKAQGVQTSFHYPPIHTFTAYQHNRDRASLPITEAVAEREVTLPLYPTLREDDVVMVAQTVAAALRQS